MHHDMNRSQDLLTDIFHHAIKAVNPYQAVSDAGPVCSPSMKKGAMRGFSTRFGKAVSPMLRAIKDTMGRAVTDGVAITKHGYPVDRGAGDRIRIYEAGHPLPNENGLRAAMEAMALARAADEKTLLVCLISGGGSALLVAPYPGISLREKQETTDLLLRAGADIRELNTVRKHVSMSERGEARRDRLSRENRVTHPL